MKPDTMPPWCTLLQDTVWPNDLVINLSNGLVSVIVRRLFANKYLAIPKYLITSQGKWYTPYFGYLKRLIELYAPKLVHTLSKSSYPISFAYIPHYGTRVPIVSIPSYKDLSYVCSGKNVLDGPALVELDKKSEYSWSAVITKIQSLVGMDRARLSSMTLCTWPTGSILLGSFNRLFSDIDIVYRIDDVNCYKKLIEFIELFEAGNRDLQVSTAINTRYVIREARWRDLEPAIMKRALKAWQRLIVEGFEVSISLVNVSKRVSEEKRIIKLNKEKVTEQVLYVSPYQDTVGDFPSIVESNKGYIVSYDGIYAPLLFEGGKLFVRGIEAEILAGDERLKAIVIGVSEARTFAYRLT